MSRTITIDDIDYTREIPLSEYINMRKQGDKILLTIWSRDCDHNSGYSFIELPADAQAVEERLDHFEQYEREGPWSWHLVPPEQWEQLRDSFNA